MFNYYNYKKILQLGDDNIESDKLGIEIYSTL